MSDQPVWGMLEVVLAIHKAQLAEHGGADGIRDLNALESAVASPRNLYSYGNPKPDIPAFAAQYGFAIATNHAFVDGNKRTAEVVCRLFLIRNGFNINATDKETYDTFLGVANNEIDADQLAGWIRSKLC